MGPLRVILLPGIVTPAEIAYGAFMGRFHPDVEPVAKDLEVYATPEPPEDYTLDVEVAGVLREADARGWKRFTSSGTRAGAQRLLAVAATIRSGLRALRCSSPPGPETGTSALPRRRSGASSAGSKASRPTSCRRSRASTSSRCPIPEPPPGDPPPWMARRPAGIRAINSAFQGAPSTAKRSATSIGPSTSRSAPSAIRLVRRDREAVEQRVPGLRARSVRGRHHFDPPHRSSPSAWRVAQASGSAPQPPLSASPTRPVSLSSSAVNHQTGME